MNLILKKFIILLTVTYYVDIRQINKDFCIIEVQKENSNTIDSTLVKCDDIDKKDYSEWIKQIVRK